ncbi:penicillin acylase family protein [Solitalea longa]|uniref:Penicillin acylase family protein n=1 Tax=Solitalea longa TaxID=2079460 RepID=A0A2S5A8J2_9SPHI|nr:penicillin acylase family protein [Solitalea longa]POY38423.1 penicillin acylase family protein [Solitalea longa]
MKIFKAIALLVVSGALFYLMDNKTGPIPPLGRFLSPYMGFWQNAEVKKTEKEQSFSLPGVKEEVSILYDENRIPHIFAKNDYDAYFAQGYVTAKDRLWQMDFQTRFAAGRIAEVIGDKAIELDKYKRRSGMVYGAEQSLKGMMENPASRMVVEAYTAGINAYIASLSPKEYPIEFKILDYKPEAWTPLKCALLLKQMTSTLAGGSDDFYLTNILKQYGPSVVKDLFPDYPFREDPIIPVGTKWAFNPLKAPETPSSFIAMMTDSIHPQEKIEGIGSNNWAVSGSKTASGLPILSNDPHLDLTLPSIWYQIQIVTPTMNVYGVSLPGSPHVIIGFNKDVSWGVTNVDADVLDWYQVKFKDNNKDEYWWNNKWNKTTKRTETIGVRNGTSITDTVIYTHQGPVVYDSPQEPFKDFVPVGTAMRWIAHDKSDELATFYKLNRAKNYNDYREALRSYVAPAQNFVFADNQNDIAITPNGKYPLKWKEQGKFVLDGTDPKNDWQGWIPAEQNPTVKNPERGFVSSANQSSTDPSYPYYLNWEFAPYERGTRINRRLAQMNHITVDSIRSLQNDNYSIHAENVKTIMISLIDQGDLRKKEEVEGYRLLNNWNDYYNANEIAATIFDEWYSLLRQAIWADDFSGKGSIMRFPSRDRTAQIILHEQNSKWVDNIKTPQKETLAELVTQTYSAAIDSLTQAHGPMGEKWQWGYVKDTFVPHLAKIPGFNSKHLFNGGSKGSVNALSQHNGPSWRMIVELGESVKAYGVYPGGQSGNPGSWYYDNMVDTWSEGKLNELVYLLSPTAKDKRIISVVKLNK